jgi:cytochrome c-type biogenesis protein
MGVSVFAAFLAGLVSFLSPCVLPLVPGYVSMLSGIGVEQLRQGQTPRRNLMSSAIAFVSGFSVVFIVLGASASAIGRFLAHHRSVLPPIAGAVILLFGLYLIGVLGKITWAPGFIIGATLVAAGVLTELHPGLFGANFHPLHFFSLAAIPLFGPYLARWLSRDVHFQNLGGNAGKEKGPFAGVLSGFLLGFAFACGWTPCVGPILSFVLALAATTQNLARGIFLLALYSAGLAIPFLLTALGLSRFLSFYQHFRKYLHAVEVASGFLLLAMGFLIFTNRLTWLSDKLSFLGFSGGKNPWGL